ncbi:NAD(P)H-dependent oxidoreductase [Pseudoflavitalea sp. X16]|uniref:NADPH-dependent FMN reductase n=1 Tax=Paraflavitalea devenefica TaxID=2716334 RepID=UPI0014226DD6|nr:NAD(P)H-dependent oxidoreductase [Paraflavitalea devenefica]NII27233.1 NAD(P)H-dependent oxidoreductase [Paraflavitalea devenefica]
MNDFYTIISGTNRAGSNTRKIAQHYCDLLEAKGIETRLVSLEGWKSVEKTPEYVQLEKEVLIPCRKFIFVAPEYNGSIPGVLKVMLDISDYKKVWWGKKALLTGVALGRSGNVRGMEHLTGILHFMKVVVHPNKLPISSVDKLLNGSGVIHDTGTLEAIKTQVDEFIAF